jgi:hypothetical protein
MNIRVSPSKNAITISVFTGTTQYFKNIQNNSNSE